MSRHVCIPCACLPTCACLPFACLQIGLQLHDMQLQRRQDESRQRQQQQAAQPAAAAAQQQAQQKAKAAAVAVASEEEAEEIDLLSSSEEEEEAPEVRCAAATHACMAAHACLAGGDDPAGRAMAQQTAVWLHMPASLPTRVPTLFSACCAACSYCRCRCPWRRQPARRRRRKSRRSATSWSKWRCRSGEWCGPCLCDAWGLLLQAYEGGHGGRSCLHVAVMAEPNQAPWPMLEGPMLTEAKLCKPPSHPPAVDRPVGAPVIPPEWREEYAAALAPGALCPLASLAACKESNARAQEPILP